MNATALVGMPTVITGTTLMVIADEVLGSPHIAVAGGIAAALGASLSLVAGAALVAWSIQAGLQDLRDDWDARRGSGKHRAAGWVRIPALIAAPAVILGLTMMGIGERAMESEQLRLAGAITAALGAAAGLMIAVMLHTMSSAVKTREEE